MKDNKPKKPEIPRWKINKAIYNAEYRKRRKEAIKDTHVHINFSVFEKDKDLIPILDSKKKNRELSSYIRDLIINDYNKTMEQKKND